MNNREKIKLIKNGLQKLSDKAVDQSLHSKGLEQQIYQFKAAVFQDVISLFDEIDVKPSKSVWHESDEKPEIGKKLLIICYSGNAYAGYHNSISHDSIKQWAYIDDLLEL